MKLFSNGYIENLLPFDGIAEYFPDALTEDESQKLFDTLWTNIEWKPDEVVIAGKRIVTKRKIAWHGNSAFSYIYSGTAKQAREWTTELLALRELAQTLAGSTFNSCLLNLYHSGEEGLGWHSDNEDTLVRNGTIASLSLGAERSFVFKHRKTKESIPILLEHGSLLAMKGETQSHWVHSLPKTVKLTEPRISLTFRMMKDRD